MRVTRLTLVRPGETVRNAENRYAGSTDIPLSPHGATRQLGELSRSRRHLGIAIVKSPKRRRRHPSE